MTDVTCPVCKGSEKAIRLKPFLLTSIGSVDGSFHGAITIGNPIVCAKCGLVLGSPEIAPELLA